MAKDHPDILIPPPIFFFGALLIAYLLERIHPLPLQLPIAPGPALCLLAIALSTYGSLELKRAGTTVSPRGTTTAICTSGPYKVTRNPLYLSLLVLLAGISCIAHSFWYLLAGVPLFAILNFHIIPAEERYLEGKFGDHYRGYKETVRRWL